MSKITVSTVTPVYSGEGFLGELVSQIETLRDSWKEDGFPLEISEVILVDDCSIDNSAVVLREIAEKFDWVRVITLSRNFGQHGATVAGICHTSTDWVVTLDEDLQHSPKEIQRLFAEQAKTGADVVYAAPEEGVHGQSWRDRGSRGIKKILAKMSSVPQINSFNSFRLVRGSIARAAASSSSSQTYLDIAISWFTQNYTTIKLPMQDTRYIDQKKSGYTLSKLLRHARRLLVSAHVDVAAAGLILGGVTTAIAFIFGCWVIVQKIFLPQMVNAAGWASSIALSTFIGGIIIVLLCMILEYINVLVVNQLGKPTFFTIDRSQDEIISRWFDDR